MATRNKKGNLFTRRHNKKANISADNAPYLNYRDRVHNYFDKRTDPKLLNWTWDKATFGHGNPVAERRRRVPAAFGAALLALTLGGTLIAGEASEKDPEGFGQKMAVTIDAVTPLRDKSIFCIADHYGFCLPSDTSSLGSSEPDDSSSGSDSSTSTPARRSGGLNLGDNSMGTADNGGNTELGFGYSGGEYVLYVIGGDALALAGTDEIPVDLVNLSEQLVV